jgi:alpha-galactosidase
MTPVEIKIAYIGGGSRDWARKLMNDLALCPPQAVSLYDIDPASARLNAELGTWLQDQPGVVSRWQYSVSDSITEALTGADFVILSVQPGSLEVMAEEIAIAEEYGLYFPVGDSTGAPGLARGLRSAGIYAGFAEAIAATCPDAWVINYTNPMSVCTQPDRVAGLKVFGCCHGSSPPSECWQGWPGDLGSHPTRRAEIQVNVLGINHFTWIDRAFYQEHDLLALLKDIARPGVIRPFTPKWRAGTTGSTADRVKFTLFQRFACWRPPGTAIWWNSCRVSSCHGRVVSLGVIRTRSAGASSAGKRSGQVRD